MARRIDRHPLHCGRASAKWLLRNSSVPALSELETLIDLPCLPLPWTLQRRLRRISGASVVVQFRTLDMKALELAPSELMRLLTPTPSPARSSCSSSTCSRGLCRCEGTGNRANF